MCGASGATAAVTRKSYPCDISCSLAKAWERLQGSFSQTNMRILIKFHVLLGKSMLEYYKLLKEGLGIHPPSYEAVGQWVNAIKNGQEEMDDIPCSAAPILATNECHVKQVKSVPECTQSISCMATATKVRLSTASVYYILTNSLGKKKTLCEVDSTHDQQ